MNYKHIINLIDSNRLDEISIRMTLVDEENWEEFDIYFNFINSEISKKWAKHYSELKLGPHFIRESSLKGNYHEKDLYLKFKNVIRNINEFYDQPIDMITDVNEVVLNYLHHCYEEYGKRLDKLLNENYWKTAYTKIPADSIFAKRWPGIEFNQDMHLNFLKLNELIHSYEFMYKENESNRNNAIVTYSLWPRHDFELTDDDWNNIVKYPMFGDFCLGYNTLGKNLEHIVFDTDYDAIERNAIINQTNWSSEVFINLNGDANVDSATDNYKKQWDKLRVSELLGLNFGEYKENREGYIKIAEIDNISKNDSLNKDGDITLNFCRYSKIHSIELVISSQKYKTGLARTPHWKQIQTNHGKKITNIENHTNKITWVLNNACNYDCYYCPESLHNGDNTKWKWEVVEPFLNHIMNRYGKNTVYSLSGGEPTLSPFFPHLIRRINDFGSVCGITTNLGRTPRFIMENFGYLKYAACSFHPSMIFPEHRADEFLEKAILAQEYTNVSIRVMMDPLHWDQTVEFIDRLSKEFYGDVSLVWIQNQYGNSTHKICELTYTTEQNDYIINFKHKPVNKNINSLRFSKLSEYGKKEQYTVIYEDGTQIHNPTPQYLINMGETRFFDWTCKIGKESLFISHDGAILRGNCRVGGTLGNINEYESIDWKQLETPVRCTEGWCQCGADVPISKSIYL